MGSYGVEVAQSHVAKSGIAHRDIVEQFFHHQLGLAVGADRGEWVALGNRQFLWHAVHGAGGTEYKLTDAVSAHCVQQPDRSANVGFVVLERLFDGLADGFQAREMNHSTNLES